MTDNPAQSPAELYTLAQRAAAAGQLEEARRLFEWAEAAAGKAAQPPAPPPLQAPDLRTYLERRYQPPGPPPGAPQAPAHTSTAPAPQNAPQGPQDGAHAEQPAPRRWAGGRPRKPPGTTAGESRSIRLNEPRWLKLRALGMTWLAAQIDAAPEPTPDAIAYVIERHAKRTESA